MIGSESSPGARWLDEVEKAARYSTAASKLEIGAAGESRWEMKLADARNVFDAMAAEIGHEALAVESHYLTQTPWKVIASRLGVTTRSVLRYRNRAVEWLDRNLSAQENDR